ncbi:uncharacterized protein [Chelonus insularis]|uniref:uncharacterized protein n=1 Tax=Chelonus insularis TaxID=460826 RepID=UPI00158B18E2|nr:uncharacterized protein LOC118065683 [Chelonus insularis]
MWVGKCNRRGDRESAMFNSELWSVYDAVKANCPRTNNAVEGWHHSFNNRAQSAHLYFWKFINLLKEEQSNTEIVIEQLSSGAEPVMKRKKYRDYDCRVFNVVAEYNSENICRYLKCIANNLKL